MALLTIADLAARWSLSTPEAWELVRLGGVPFVNLGRGEVDLTRRGRKPVRFALADVIAWEQSRARVWSDDARRRAAARKEPTVRIVGAAIGGRLKSGVGRRPQRGQM